MKKTLILLSIAMASGFSSLVTAQKNTAGNTAFVKVKDMHFEVNGKPIYYLGANFWAGANLGSKKEGGNRARLLRELDYLKSIGISNLRIMAGTEGPDGEPYRIAPALQKAPGVYNQDVLDGLDFLLAEMAKRKMYAVMCLNNYWQWSGGMAQYLVWAKYAESIPYPNSVDGSSWSRFMSFSAKFYSNDPAKELFKKHIAFLANRINPYTKVAYKNDPAIFSWQLGNEPRGHDNVADFQVWLKDISAYIKSQDKNHMVSIGSEGMPTNIMGNNVLQDHSSPNIDYITLHIWIQNFGWYNPLKADSTLPPSKALVLEAFNKHFEWAKTLNKPVVMEEFGIARDNESLDPTSPTTKRDDYYQFIFENIYKSASEKKPIVGANFWAWGGEGRPSHKDWMKGDEFIGDPPHESQGWYSIYNTDKSTVGIITKYANLLNSLK